MAVFYSFVAALFCGTVAIAGTIPLGGPCDPSAVHLDPQTHRLVTDCDDTTFCLASPYPSNSSSLTTGGSCQPRRCRRDEFPFGFQDLDADAAEARALPPLCPRGSFCPDVESGCLPLVPPGGACEMARDEQCALPPAAGGVGRTPSDAHAEEVYASPMQRRRRTALCLNLICMYVRGHRARRRAADHKFGCVRYANATLGQRCIIDQALYAESAPDGRSFNISVVRDNCVRPRFFCDGASTACASTKGLGAPCVRDGECESVRSDGLIVRNTSIADGVGLGVG